MPDAFRNAALSLFKLRCSLRHFPVPHFRQPAVNTRRPRAELYIRVQPHLRASLRRRRSESISAPITGASSRRRPPRDCRYIVYRIVSRRRINAGVSCCCHCCIFHRAALTASSPRALGTPGRRAHGRPAGADRPPARPRCPVTDRVSFCILISDTAPRFARLGAQIRSDPDIEKWVPDPFQTVFTAHLLQRADSDDTFC